MVWVSWWHPAIDHDLYRDPAIWLATMALSNKVTYNNWGQSFSTGGLADSTVLGPIILLTTHQPYGPVQNCSNCSLELSHRTHLDIEWRRTNLPAPDYQMGWRNGLNRMTGYQVSSSTNGNLNDIPMSKYILGILIDMSPKNYCWEHYPSTMTKSQAAATYLKTGCP